MQRVDAMGPRWRVLVLVAMLAVASGCPAITSVAPNPATPGQLITVTGQRFTDSPVPYDAVLYDGLPLLVVSWTDTKIVAVLPAQKANGTYSVQVRHDGEVSNALSHTIQSTGPLITGLKFTPNLINHLSGTLEFQTSVPATSSVSVASATGTWTVPSTGILTAEPGTQHKVAVVGMPPLRAHTMTVTARDSGGVAGAAASVGYTPGPVPDTFPPLQVTVRQPGQYAPGLTLFGMTRGLVAADTGLYVVNDLGEPVWYYRKPVSIFNHTAQLNNGNFLSVDSNGLVLEVDLLGNIVHQWTSNRGGILHHDVEELPSGNLMMIDVEKRVIPGYPGGQTLNVVGDVIVERSRQTGATVWEVSLLDLLDPHRIANQQLFDAASYDFIFGVSTKDWSHSNGLFYDASDDSIIVSLRSQDIIIKISRATRQLVWVAGVDLPSTSGDDAWPWLHFSGSGDLPNYPHGPTLGPTGHLLVYDNGNERPVEYSRAAEYSIDSVHREIRQVWEYVDPTYDPPLFAPWLGDVDQFAGGTALVCDAGLFDSDLVYLRFAKLTEVRESDKQKVWELMIRDPANLEGFNGYDAQRIQSLYPPVN